MTVDQLLVSLPIADRRRSYDFYRAALGLEAVGELADDGVPEPLQFVLNAGTRLMLVPTGGFGWVVDPHRVVEHGASECLLGVGVASDGEVRAVAERARAVGASVLTEPGPKPWGYVVTFADPDGHVWTVTSSSTG